MLFRSTKGNPVAAPKAAMVVPAGLNAQQVIDKYITAIGGKDALLKIQDMTTQMTTEVQGTPVLITRKDKAPNKSMMAITVMGNVMMKKVSDGQKATQTAQGQSKKLEGKEADEMLVQDALFPELRYAENKVTSILDGAEKVDGKDTFKVKNTTPSGLIWTDFFDAGTGLKLQTMSMQKGPQGEVAQIVSYGDYKAVNGVMVPHQIKQPMGPMTLIMAVEKVEVNKGLPDTDFSVN